MPAFLPAASQAERAIAALPMVRAAEARVAESQARGEALAAGPYGFQATLMPSARNEHHGPLYSEWEAQLTRSLRLPDKAALDRALGAAGTEAAMLAADDARHAGARLLLERWFAWLRAAHETRLLQAQRHALAREQAALEKRVATGDAAWIDLDRAAALLAELDAAVAQGRLVRDQARVSLVAAFPVLEMPAEPPALPQPPAELPDPEAAVAGIVARSHEIGIAQAIAASQMLTARRADANRLPDPSIGVRVVDEGDHQEQLLGLVLSWSFPTRANRADAVAEGHLAAARAVEAEAVRRDVEMTARQLVETLPARRAAWHAARAAQEASRTAARRVERAYALGEAGFAELGLARRQEHEAVRREILALLDLHQAHLEIAIDSHTLWARHFATDPHDHAGGAD